LLIGHPQRSRSQLGLGDWLASIATLKLLPDTLLVLPSHGEPFTGLHARLDALHRHIEEPRRAVDCFAILFGRADWLMSAAIFRRPISTRSFETRRASA
jgi:glyoxylase-like metal-dependent hydrolase (beta-lactamase superfamily II)